MSTTTVSTEASSRASEGFACYNCGVPQNISEASRLRISDLEAQVQLLSRKATAAVDKIADYEDELRYYWQLQSRNSQSSNHAPGQPTTPPLVSVSSADQGNPQSRLASPPPEHSLTSTPSNPAPPSVQIQPPPQTTSSRFSSFLPINLTRKPSPSSQPPTPGIPPNYVPQASQSSPYLLGHTSTPSEEQTAQLASLQAQLNRERQSREEAETRLNQSSTELEELTAQLFGQANEMVAQERKARAKLEERVKVLEKKDEEKRRRLEKLEKAIGRIERVRGLVSAPD